MSDAISLYPVVIRESRYSGVYEGGKWFAIAEYLEESEGLANYISGDDCEALDFWDSEEAKMIGVGDSPNDALSNLYLKHGIIEDEKVTLKEANTAFDYLPKDNETHSEFSVRWREYLSGDLGNGVYRLKGEGFSGESSIS
jgi:hypothetical protein